jgi:hypothetical protein
MADLNLDFGDGALQTGANAGGSNGSTQDITGGAAKNAETDITNKDNNNNGNNGEGNNNGGTDGNNNQGNQGSEGNNNNGEGEQTTDSSTGGLEPGTVIEFEGTEYTVADNGDIVDKDGNVFKAAADVQAWLDENEQTDDNSLDGASVEDIIASVGIEVNDEKGNKIEFSNDKEGLKAYINAVTELKSEETRKATLNKFYQDNPVVKQFVDYMTDNGGNPRGFGEIPDRSGITVDKDNQNQQEQIIRVAAAEFGNKGVTDAYIKYLKDSGALYDEAVNQLVALQEKDKAIRTKIQNDAENARKAEEEAVRAYWENVNKLISSREIAGYKIPESFTKEVNGQKVTYTPDDFYDYLYRAKELDANGNKITGYQRDLDKLTDEELLNKEILDAWLMFTGGTYKDLVNMAIKEHEVHKLIIKSKQQRSTRTIKINKPADKGNINDIVFD